ncbi:MAG: calcium/sodium antiporter [Alphaproteobacteria bacterium]
MANKEQRDFMMYGLVIAGLILLLIGGDLLVRGAVALASHYGLPPLIIGLTVVAFGTSAPELMISLQSAMAGAPGIAVGNVVGSNIANVLLVLGVPAIIAPILCNQSGVRRNTLMMVGATLVFILFANSGEFSRGNGIIMTLMLAGFLAYSGHRAMQGSGADASLEEVEGIPDSKAKTIGYIVGGIIGLPLGADLMVRGATDIAAAYHVSDAVIGLTIVALGTSLPELATTVVAAIRGRSDVAIGNVIGSNMFNILAILGITAIVIPLPVPPNFLNFDLWILLGVTCILVPVALFHVAISRVMGILFVAAYLIYIVTVVAQGEASASFVTPPVMPTTAEIR